MATLTIITPKTAADATGVLTTDGYESVVLHADGLAGAEEVDITVLGGGSAVPYTAGGTAVKLTATQPNVELPPGPTYGIAKDATAASCGVYASVRGEPC